MSGAVATGGLELYPAALGVLVASKAYGVVRSAVVPRLLPPGFSLVKANSRVTLGGSARHRRRGADRRRAAARSGRSWPLYGACVIFLRGYVPVLHAAAQGGLGEGRAPGPAAADPSICTARTAADNGRACGRSVRPVLARRSPANASLRGLSGFLIFFLAFLLREHPLAGQSAAVSLGMVGVAAGVGQRAAARRSGRGCEARGAGG